MRISFFDPIDTIHDLLPLTFTKPCSEIRVGIDTIREKWSHYLGSEVFWKTTGHLQEKYPESSDGEVLHLNSCLIPDLPLVEKIKSLTSGTGLKAGETILAFRGEASIDLRDVNNPLPEELEEWDVEFDLIQNLWDIFSKNPDQIVKDLERMGVPQRIPEDEHSIVYGKENVYLEEGAKVRASIFNAENGPIHLSEGAIVHEGSILYGPLSVGKNSQISPGSKIRGGTTIGPNCKVGGEVNNSVFFGFSNKAHDGFLGNSVIGEWCNLGADTNNSNLKNNYDEVKLWNFRLKKFQKTGKQFCGLIMGDHSKCSINTMFNTGTVVGIGANIFGSGFHSNLIPSFSWGGPQGRTTFHLNRFFQTAEIVMKRRGLELEEVDKRIFEKIFEMTAENRSWEKK